MNLRYFLTGGLLLSGIFTALFGMARYWSIHTLSYFLAIQIICGFVQSSGWPSVVSCVANWNGRGNRGLVMGIWNSHAAFGNILGSVIAGAFVNYNWGLSFIIPSLFPIIMAILTFFFLVPEPEDINCKNPNIIVSSYPDIETDVDPQGLISETAEHVVNHTSIGYQHLQRDDEYEDLDNQPLLSESNVSPLDKDEDPVSFRKAFMIPGVLEFSACLFFAKMISYTFLFWLPSYIKSTMPHLKDMEVAADLSTLFDIGGIAGGILAGIISDKSHSPAIVCEVMLIFSAPIMFIYQQYGHLSMAFNIVLLITCGILVNGPYGLITTAVSADLGTHPALQGSGKALATVTAIIDGSGSMGAALGPLLTGVISPYGWNNVFYMLITADIIAMMMLIRLVKKEITGCHSMRNLHH